MKVAEEICWIFFTKEHVNELFVINGTTNPLCPPREGCQVQCAMVAKDEELFVAAVRGKRKEGESTSGDTKNRCTQRAVFPDILHTKLTKL